MTVYRGYIGTYTKGDSKGIYTFTLDTETAILSEPTLVAQIENPTYLSLTNDEKMLYAVAKQDNQGGIASFEINQAEGQLILQDMQVSEGVSPCYVSVDNDNQHVVAAHYHRGTVEVYPVIEDELKPTSSIVHFQGTGPNVERQEKPHVHYANFTPDNKYAIVVDLGTDQIVTFSLHNSQLQKAHSLSVKPGSGPRHLTFHPNGKYAYVMTELSNEIIVLAYNPEDGNMMELQYISTIPADFTDNSQGSAIHISSDGRFIYAGNRGHNSIATFAVNEETGLLTFVSYTHTEGDWPRDFTLDPTEAFLVASNQESHNLVLFARNSQTGQLTKLASEVFVPYPVCLKFLKNK